MRAVILRRERGHEDEKAAMEEFFPVITSRLEVQADDLVIGRYSVLPYYDEVEADVLKAGGRMINTTKQHNWIADLGNWAGEGGVLEGLTPAAWSWHEFTTVLSKKFGSGPYVLKGGTNSRKYRWNTHMFAKDRKAAIDVCFRLNDDSLIGDQPIYVRPFVKFFELMKGENGLPIVREFRFFMLDGEVLAGGFYWSDQVDDIKQGIYKNLLDPRSVPPAFLKDVAERIAPYAPFTAVDVAVSADQTTWLVTDVNDGQMSGLSEVDPYHLYKTLKEKVG